MAVIQNSEVETFEFPGIRHQTVGGHKQGLKSMEVWVQTIAPGAVTPVHCHACEEVVTHKATVPVAGRKLLAGSSAYNRASMA